MIRSRSRANRIWVALLLLGTASTAAAGSLAPNPATGTSPAKLGTNSVSLIPNPASYQTQCSWLTAAANLATAPYNLDPKNPWVFNYAANFNGKFTLNTYKATIGGAVNAATSGGADFSLTYKAGDGDPSGNDVRWMQVIEVNKIGYDFIKNKIGFAPDTGFPQAGYSVVGNGTNGVPTGSYAFLDNAGFGPGNGAKPTDPWYGWLTATNGTDITTSTAATSTSFSDNPTLSFVPGMVVQFQTFVAKDVVTNNGLGGKTNTVTMYGGVWWGFQDAVPEPSSWILMVSGGGFIVLASRRRLVSRLGNAA